VQYNTDYRFEALGTFPAGTQFVWQFGDGATSTTTAPTASHVYTQTGNFGITVEGRSGSTSSASTAQVSVRSLVGRWVGTMSGHTVFPPGRPVAITSFELTVTSSTPDGPSLILNGSWADNAGCRVTRTGFIRQSLNPKPLAEVTFGMESFVCADGDFYMTGTADTRFDRVEGSCAPRGGPNCRFSMVRQ
jgi:PKD repeat protein